MITPETKDWTWVIHRMCPECGFDATAIDVTEVGSRLRQSAVQWRGVLARPDVTVRPAPNVWSPLEYGAHVRDACRIYDGRVALMLSTDGAEFENWDQDAAAIENRYSEQDPDVVAKDLDQAAHQLADRFDGVSGEQWQRTGLRSNGSHFTVDSISRYFLHDVVHHLWDVRDR